MAESLAKTTQDSQQLYNTTMGDTQTVSLGYAPRIAETNSSFGNDIDKLMGATEKAAKTYYQLSDDATDMVAMDHLVQYEEKKNEILSNPDLDYDGKKAALASTVSGIIETGNKHFENDDRARERYDRQFLDKTRVDYSRTISSIDIEQEKFLLDKQETFIKESTAKNPNISRELVLSNAKTLIAKGRTTEQEIDNMLVDGKLKYISAMYEAKPESVISRDGKINYDNLESTIGDYVAVDKATGKLSFKSDNAELNNSITMFAGKLKDVNSRRIEQEQNKLDNDYENAYKEKLMNTTDLAGLNTLANEIKNNKSMTASARYSLWNSVDNMVSGMQNKVAKEQVAEAKDSIKNFGELFTFKSDDSQELAELKSKRFKDPEFLETAYKNTVNNIKSIYKKDTVDYDREMEKAKNTYFNGVKAREDLTAYDAGNTPTGSNQQTKMYIETKLSSIEDTINKVDLSTNEGKQKFNDSVSSLVSIANKTGVKSKLLEDLDNKFQSVGGDVKSIAEAKKIVELGNAVNNAGYVTGKGYLQNKSMIQELNVILGSNLDDNKKIEVFNNTKLRWNERHSVNIQQSKESGVTYEEGYNTNWFNARTDKAGSNLAIEQWVITNQKPISTQDDYNEAHDNFFMTISSSDQSLIKAIPNTAASIFGSEANYNLNIPKSLGGATQPSTVKSIFFGALKQLGESKRGVGRGYDMSEVNVSTFNDPKTGNGIVIYDRDTGSLIGVVDASNSGKYIEAMKKK